eukprot:1689019-Prymnesium_polylepis.1
MLGLDLPPLWMEDSVASLNATSLAALALVLPHCAFAEPPLPLPASEGANFSKFVQRRGEEPKSVNLNLLPCKSFVGAARCAMEWDVWVMVRSLITPAHTVIEFGARSGTTSCVLAEATNNSGKVVSVEPDRMTIESLVNNRDVHRCNFHIVNGTVGGMPMAAVGSKTHHSTGRAYDFLTRPARAHETAVPHLPLATLQSSLGLRFNAAIIDCEGCIEQVLGRGDDRDTALIDQLVSHCRDSMQTVAVGFTP